MTSKTASLGPEHGVPYPVKARPLLGPLVASLLIGICLLWSYWPTLAAMAERWSRDPQYSHGYLVPVFALVLLWIFRDKLTDVHFRPNLIGLGLIVLACGLRLVGTVFYLDWVGSVSFICTLVGICQLFLGWPGLRWALPAIAYLLFMVPLPFRLQTALGGPLQRIATAISTYCLQTLGFPAVAEGNVILLQDVRMGVEEACSGLTMLLTFFALATAMAIVVQRHWTDRLVIVVSAIPIAIATNVLRITVTGVLHQTAGHEIAQAVYHDWAGWLMIPVALALLSTVPWFLSRLLREPTPDAPPTLELLGGKPGPAGLPAKLTPGAKTV